jgi:filamentous hemagglutinin
VTLPDGSTQRVLVPQVYVRVRPGDVDGTGALLAGRTVDIRLSGDLTNASGTVAGRQAVVLNADSIANLGGRITGHSVDARADTDLKNIGGVIDAEQSVRLGAGRDLQVETTTRTSSGIAFGSGMLSDTVVDRVAGVYVGRNGGSGGMLEMTSGRDTVVVAATIGNQSQGGSTRLAAGRDLTLDTVTTARSEHAAYAPGQMRRRTAPNRWAPPSARWVISNCRQGRTSPPPPRTSPAAKAAWRSRPAEMPPSPMANRACGWTATRACPASRAARRTSQQPTPWQVPS